MSSFKKDKKQAAIDIKISSIEDNNKSELNITSNINPGSVLVSAKQPNENQNENITIDISNNNDATEVNSASSEIKSEELLDIVLNTNISPDIINNTDLSTKQIESSDLLTYNNKSSKKINTFRKNVSKNAVDDSKPKVESKNLPSKKEVKISKKSNANSSKPNSKIKTTIKSSTTKTTKHNNIKDFKNLKTKIASGKQYFKDAAISIRDYQLPKIVTNALFLIILMFVACISLIISINNRSNKRVSTGIIKKTYISPIYEVSASKSLGAFSQSTIESVSSPAENITQNTASAMEILNEIAQLQNAVSIDAGASVAIDSAAKLEDTIVDEKEAQDEENRKAERLNNLLKSYVIISPSVDASVNQIFYEYFDSRMNVDIEKYLSLFGYDTSKINIESFSGLKKTLEYERSLIGMITNIKIYICNGFEQNEKICFVNYDMLLRYANALVPSVFYANIALEGERYVIKPELDRYRQVYIDHIIKHDEIKSLNYNVQTRLSKVLENNDFARLVYVSLRDKQIKIDDQKPQDNDEYGSYIIQKQGGVFSVSEPVNKVVLNDLRSQVPYDSIPSYHGLLTDPLLR